MRRGILRRLPALLLLFAMLSSCSGETGNDETVDLETTDTAGTAVSEENMENPPAERPEDTARLSFTEPPGIYKERFSLHVESGAEKRLLKKLEIRYTTDSSVPTIDSKLYDPEEGIAITYRGGGARDPSRGNIIRCAAFVDEEQVGDVLTGTYIIADLPEVRYSTMIVSIVCEPDDLYGYERGILVPGKIRDDFLKHRPATWTNDSLQDANYFQKGRDWERPAHVEFYTKDGELLLGQNVGVRVSGGWNRNNSHKSLRLFARYDYDDTNVMTFDAYPGLESLTGVPVGSFKSLILRTGSNNFWNTTIQTPFLMSLGKEIGIDTMEYRPVCVYLNGKYYGFMALFEDYSPTYFETNYNLPADGITCINGAGKVDGSPRDWELDNGPESELREFRKMISYITTLDMREERFYEKASEMLDLDSFIRYMCFQGYIANSDWPQNNVRVWRYYPNGYDPDAEQYGADGRWRFLLKDLDLAAGYGDSVEESIFMRLDSDDGGLRLNAVFQSLFRNADFRNRVYCFLCDLLSTTMRVDNVMSKLGEMEASALIEMRYYAPSWGASGGSNANWHENLSTPATFFASRYDIVKDKVSKKYDSPYVDLEVLIDGEGKVNISTLTLDADSEESLQYLIGLRIPVAASPARGWRLRELTVDGKNIDGEFMMTRRSMTLRAVFEPDPEYSEPEYGLVFNEARYEQPRLSEDSDMIELLNSGGALYLKGYRLVRTRVDENGKTKEKSWDFPAITIPSGGYMTIACDKLGTRKGQTDYHASFGIRSGDTLRIVDRLGNTVDSLTLPQSGNYSTAARDETSGEWYFEPYATFGEPNTRAEGYRLSDVIDGRCRGQFIMNGKLVEDFAEEKNGAFVVTERNLRDLVGQERFGRYEERLSAHKVNGGYDLEGALDLLSYGLYYIDTLESYVLYRIWR